MSFLQTSLARVSTELGLPSLLSSPRDTHLLCLQRFVRLFAYGSSTLVLVQFLSSLGISDARIGLFMTLTLLGDVVISFFLTIFADGLGRKNVLAAGSLLMAASGVVFALADGYWVLVAAAVFGVISPSGNEIGPFRAIEESTLAQLTPKDSRSDIFAWYTLIGTAGAALGTLACGGAIAALENLNGGTSTGVYRVVFWMYSVIGLIKLALSLLLSKAVEAEPPKPLQVEEIEIEAREGLLANGDTGDNAASTRKPAKLPGRAPPSPWTKIVQSLLPHISQASLRILTQLCLLFAIDSLASGLVPSSWTIYFFVSKFSLAPATLGTLFFVTNIIAAFSSLAAASLARRVGPLKTMVFTHLPSALFLALIPAPSNVLFAMAFLVLRSCTSSMDQAPRQAFLSAAVLPGERTSVLGVVNVVKTLSQSGGMSVTGWLVGKGRFGLVFVVAGAMKASYDLGLLTLFLNFKGREDEEDVARGEGSARVPG